MSEKINVRFASAEDADIISEIYGYYVENSAVTFENDVPDADEIRRRMERTGSKYPYLVALSEGEIVGFAYASALRTRPAYDYCVETTIYICNDMRRKGVGHVIYKALEDILRDQGVLNLYACIATCYRADEYLTKASPLFHSHMGYKAVGTFRKCGYRFGNWYDVTWMEKVLGDHPKTPKFTPVAEIREKWAEKLQSV